MKKLCRHLYYLDDLIAGFCLALIVLVTFGNSFMRYALQAPIVWAEEVNLALVVWFVCIGASSATKRAGHVAVDFLVEKSPPRIRRAIEWATLAVSALLLSLLAYWGLRLSMAAGLKLTNLLKIPFMYIDLALPLGCGFMLVHLFLLMFHKTGQA